MLGPAFSGPLTWNPENERIRMLYVSAESCGSQTRTDLQECLYSLQAFIPTYNIVEYFQKKIAK